MKKLLFTLFLLLPLIFIQPAKTGVVLVAGDNSKASETVNTRELDDRAKILAAYFAKYNSPLEYQAQDFIDAADTFGMDWKLVPAIAGVESTFGKHIPGGYNAWGWGVYGTQALGFKSWRDGIFTVSGGLKQNYIDKGLTEPYAMNKVYAASPSWGAHVTHFLGDLNKFEAEQLANKKSDAQTYLLKEAGNSAQIALN